MLYYHSVAVYHDLINTFWEEKMNGSGSRCNVQPDVSAPFSLNVTILRTRMTPLFLLEKNCRLIWPHISWRRCFVRSFALLFQCSFSTLLAPAPPSAAILALLSLDNMEEDNVGLIKVYALPGAEYTGVGHPQFTGLLVAPTHISSMRFHVGHGLNS